MEGKRIAIIDKDGTNLLDVVESTATPGVFGIVALNPDGTPISGGGSGSGDVVGPASSTDNAIARFDSTTGKLLQNSSATIDDLGNITSTDIKITDNNLYVGNVLNDEQINGIPSTETAKFTRSYDYSTRTLTLVKINDWYYYVDGKRFDITADVVFPVHDTAYGTKYFYFDNTGTAITSNTVWNILITAQVHYTFYNSANADTVKHFTANEEHGVNLSSKAHQYLHLVNGTKFISGGAISGYVIQSSTLADVTYAVATANLKDEDIDITTTAIPDGGPYTVMWRSGAAGEWNWTTTSTLPYLIGATPNIQWNEFTGATWQRTEATVDNRYVNYYVVATNLDTYSYVIIPGQTLYTTLAGAQAESFSQLNLGSSIPFQEFVPLYQVTMRRGGVYLDAIGNARIEATPRTISLPTSGSFSITGSHSALSNLGNDDHLQYQRTCNILSTAVDYTYNGTETRNNCLSVDTTTGNKTITIDPALFSIGTEINIGKPVAANSVIIDATAGKTINGAQTYILTGQWDVLTLIVISGTLMRTKGIYRDTTPVSSISGTKSEFDTACTDGNFAYSGTVQSFTTLEATATASLSLGTASTTAGSIVFKNATNANTLTLQSGVTGATIAYTLPATAPVTGQVLSSLADGTMSWATAGGGFTWGATAAAGAGTGLALTSDALGGGTPFQTSVHTASGTLTACTTTQNTYSTSRTYTLTSGSVTDNFIGTLFSRTNVTTGAGGTLLAQGPVVNITGTDTQTAGTLTPTYDLLKLQPSLLNKGSSINITVANSTVAPTNGHSYFVLGNTQAVAHIAQKIDLGTSAQGHTGLQILSYGASTSQRGITIDNSTTGTGVGLEFIGNGGSGRICTKISGNISNSSATGYGIYFASNLGGASLLAGGIAYGIYQGTLGGASGQGTAYGLYQSLITTSNTVGYGWYVLNIGSATTGNVGKWFSLNNTQSSATLEARTNNASEMFSSRTGTATTGTVADNFSLSYLRRTSIQNGAGGTFTSAGSVLKLENVATQTAGTLTDSVAVLTLAQGVTTTGNLITGTKDGSAVFTVTSTGAIISGGLGTGTLGGTGLSGRIVGDVDTGASTTVDFALRRTENTTATLGTKIYYGRQRGTLASPLVITTGDAIFDEYGYAYDGTDYAISTAISSFCEGTIAANQVPGVLTFSTASSAGALTERLRLDSAGLATFSGAIKTGAPNGGTAGSWKTGILVTTTSVFDTTRYIQLDVGGTLYKLAVCT